MTGSAECFIVEIGNVGASFRCSAEQTLLAAMEAEGKSGIPVGCRGGGCGVCKVHVASGVVRTAKMSRARLSIEEEGAGLVLACRAYPLSALRVCPVDLSSPGDVRGAKDSFLGRSLLTTRI